MGDGTRIQDFEGQVRSELHVPFRDGIWIHGTKEDWGAVGPDLSG